MSLKRQFSNSTAWMSLAASGMSVVSFLVFIIISRILSPNEIGLAVFAILVVEAGKIVINGGIAAAIVQRSEWTSDYASTCFYINLLYATLFTALVLFVGVPLTREYYDPAAVPVLQGLSLIFILEAIKVVHEGKLRREFLFKVIAMRSVLASVVSGGVGVFLALQGYGVWALVAQQLTGQLLITLVTLFSARWCPQLSFSFFLARQALTFSIPLMAAQFITILCQTLLEFMVGVILGPIALGIYRIGGRALFILQDIVIRPIEQTTLPALARLKSLSDRAEATLRMMRMSHFIIVPIFFGASAIAAEFIGLAFGEKWRESGELMGLLAIGSTPLLIRFQVSAALTAQGKSRWVLIATIMTLLVTFGLGYIAVPMGLTFAALAYVLINYLAAIVYLATFYFLFRCRGLALIKAIIPGYLASAIMLSLCLLVKTQLPTDMNEFLRILIVAGIGGMSYLFLAVLVFRPETRNFLHESLTIAPAKFSPHLIRLQSWFRLQ